jgi:sulfur carrier protein
MNVLINNKQHTLVHDSSISGMLIDLNITTSNGIAVAVNNEIIPKQAWVTHVLFEDDHVTIIRATQGG